ncbi:flagellar basal-body MS-ring/collar protein FliF [Spartinivicinus ruber]|uniref:flagellar basal-body MS-ring/collar protein FliF n=1 Tax=Spartinivicinus ruber TaxID=2683272 RepID=UPI0013D44227|nr:flagellar basal-body MS-ring/collar protein FliF [Spartinivicinus ruber]
MIQQLDANQKKKVLILAAVIVITVMIGMALFIWSFDRYVNVATNLTKEQTANIIDAFERHKVNYQFDQGNLLVDKSQLQQARLVLAKNGFYAEQNQGFELFDQENYGVTRFSQKITYQRALQGELERTIVSLAEVSNARVHIVLSDKKPFAKKATAKASVSVQLKPGAQLMGYQIKGIQQLVAGAVPDLAIEQVTVLDQAGRVISNGTTDSALASDKLSFKQQLESYYKAKITSLISSLHQVRPLVNVDIALDYTKQRVTRESALPVEGSQQGVLISSKINKQFTNESPQKNKVSKPLKSEVVEQRFAVTKEVSESVNAPGSISRITIAVIIPYALDNDQLQSVENVIKQTVGFNTSRGDAIAVTTWEPVAVNEPLEIKSNDTAVFDHSGEGEALEAHLPRSNDAFIAFSQLSSTHLVVLAGALLVLLLVFGLSYFRRNRLAANERQQLLSDINEWLKVADHAK